ncbi:ATP synthase F1 subunit epsilon [Desulfobacterota bacterium AH_259_B03_O07]|nr:ATP synthase F1 subunit epsilon [Desulfobacterota bacterium AH_259_B03_O07]
MADTIKLQVITPTKLVVDEEVEEVVAPGELGEFGVLVGHIPLITTIVPGELKYKKDGVDRSIIITGGVADVRDDKVNVLTDNVLTPDKVDTEASRKEAEAILEELKDFGGDEKEFKEIEKRLRLAQIKAGIRQV